MYCIKDKSFLQFKGTFFSKEMFFFEVRLKPCVNSTDPFDTNATVCASPEDTTNWFIGKNFILLFTNSYFDFNDFN